MKLFWNSTVKRTSLLSTIHPSSIILCAAVYLRTIKLKCYLSSVRNRMFKFVKYLITICSKIVAVRKKGEDIYRYSKQEYGVGLRQSALSRRIIVRSSAKRLSLPTKTPPARASLIGVAAKLNCHL